MTPDRSRLQGVSSAARTGSRCAPARRRPDRGPRRSPLVSAVRGHAAIGLVLLLAGALPASAGPTNRGGALLLSFHPDAVYELGTLDHCDQLGLTDPGSAVLRLPADGTPRIVGLYAVFPADSVGTMKAISFGLRYSENVRLVAAGPCNGGGMEIAMNGWPRSHGGISVHVMPEGVTTARIIPVYWFALMARGPGSFEVIPHPMPRLGGRIVSTDVPPVDEPIVDFGRIGFDAEGYLPVTGVAAPIGACCVEDRCWLLTRRECELYSGGWMGAGVGCDHDPCRPEAWGGCCLDGGCEPMTLVECARRGGIPLGIGVNCGDRPCPGPEPEQGSNLTPAPESGPGAAGAGTPASPASQGEGEGANR